MVQARKDDSTLAEPAHIGLALVHDHFLDVIGDRRRELPFRHFGILLSSGTGRSAQRVNFEVWVGREELDEPLAHRPCGARLDLVLVHIFGLER